jgi:hypothetical protein
MHKFYEVQLSTSSSSHMLDYWIDSDEKEGSLQTCIDIFIIRCIKHLL